MVVFCIHGIYKTSLYYGGAVRGEGVGGGPQYVTVVRAEILASGPAHFAYKHNDNFKR